MANPRFEKDDDIGPLVLPDEDRIMCSKCELREKDRVCEGTVINGASLAMCEAFSIKPNEILFGNQRCPYYIAEST